MCGFHAAEYLKRSVSFHGFRETLRNLLLSNKYSF